MSGGHLMTAAESVAAVCAGEITSEELVRDCIEHISGIEDTVGAWAHFDPEYSLQQAREADRFRQTGHVVGPLHGVPVGVKDIFNTRDMPTEYGCSLHAGHQPDHDAPVIEYLRAAGAIIMGKTVTTEMAVYSPGKTRNPHDPNRTPGGSSSGSAAAVAAGMVPVAVGTQTNGSVIRPASYCGVYGFKPSFGLISRTGVLRQSQPLDQIGVFARTLEDTALIAEAMMVFEAKDPDMQPRMHPALSQVLKTEPPVPPKLAFIRTAVWDQADDDVHSGFEELVEHFGDRIVEVQLPPEFDQVIDIHRTIMESDLALNFDREYRHGKDTLSDVLRQMIERGQKNTAVEYHQALAAVPGLRRKLSYILSEYDAIVTPATTGEAPVGLESTGSPVFCTLWTLCGLPAITVPAMQGSNGMPLGVQMVADRGEDARLLRTARWFTETID